METGLADVYTECSPFLDQSSLIFGDGVGGCGGGGGWPQWVLGVEVDGVGLV